MSIVEELREAFTYDAETGRIFRKNGGEAFTTRASKGCLVGYHKNRQFKAHTVAFILHFGKLPLKGVTHINGELTDNRSHNLSEWCQSTFAIPANERFERYVNKECESGCWNWTGGLGKGGYGRFRPAPTGRAAIGSHRFAYSREHGPIPDGLFVCHSCDNRRCVNPDHLWLGTALDNNRDMVAKGRDHASTRTHCIHGHEFTSQNTIRFPGYPNSRGCRTCRGIKPADIGCAHRGTGE